MGLLALPVRNGKEVVRSMKTERRKNEKEGRRVTKRKIIGSKLQYKKIERKKDGRQLIELTNVE